MCIYQFKMHSNTRTLGIPRFLGFYDIMIFPHRASLHCIAQLAQMGLSVKGTNYGDFKMRMIMIGNHMQIRIKLLFQGAFIILQTFKVKHVHLGFLYLTSSSNAIDSTCW